MQEAPASPLLDHDIDRFHPDRLLRKRLVWHARYDVAGVYTDSVTGLVGGSGTTAADPDGNSNWFRCTSNAGDGNEFGRRVTAGVCRIGHMPHLWLHIKTGADITSQTLWAGLFDGATAPTKNAAYTTSHALLRYVAGTDTGWTLSTADGAVQNPAAAPLLAIAAATEYWISFDFRVAGVLTVGFYDTNGNLLAQTSTSTRLPAAASGLAPMFCGYNIGGGLTRINYMSTFEMAFR
jgi:hypothetical protein